LLLEVSLKGTFLEVIDVTEIVTFLGLMMMASLEKLVKEVEYTSITREKTMTFLLLRVFQLM